MLKVTFRFLIACGLIFSSAVSAQDYITLQSTTSTQNSGLLEEILPQFTLKTGIEIRVVAVGTGQAIRNAMNGDGDVLLVHAKPSEQAFVADGWGIARFDVMYNDFVIVGPPSDPAAVSGWTDVLDALTEIAGKQVTFTSRGDDSGTHKAELRLWDMIGIDVAAHSGTWYRETGSGMGITLNVAIGMGAYVMSDRASWISFANKSDHQILVQGDPKLVNQYGIILVNSENHPSVKSALGQIFIDWLTGPEGQRAISEFQVNGQQLFFPNAKN